MELETLRVAAVQLQSQDNIEQNLDECRRLVSAARRDGAKLVVLPENFAYFGADETKHASAERIGDARGKIQSALSEMARGAEAFLVAGGFPEASDDRARPFNTALAYGPDGALLGAYRKIHLFDVALQDGTNLSESSGTTPGEVDALVTFDIGRFRIGLSICYDLRFPELYRALVDRGANVLLVPAAFTLHTGKDHWHTLLRARAIESQAFVIAAAQWGKHPRGRSTYGHSLVVDPWGAVIAQASDGVGIVTATLDLSYLEQVRVAVPCLSNRRL
ncbi:MAG TPA: carbon-nitrogen hydrolase family protein [Polyangiaceae bacterium]|jgi:predicted amidohydrolase|nr:carbon-nitrogen hydrolase family protein [Polyangiaceae bacterium]